MPARTEKTENWYAVHTNARQEAYAAARLWDRFPVFLPRRRVETSHARQRVVELRPALPRYLFVQAPETGLTLVNRTPGVSTTLTVAGRAPAIPPALFERFRARFDREGVFLGDDDEISDFRTAFVRGGIVRVTRGPLEGLMGRVERIDRTGGLRLLIAMFGRFVEASVVAEWAEAVSKPLSPVPAEPCPKPAR